MGALERLAEAQISSNLADDSLKLSDVDYLRASGWAAQVNPDGLMLYRLKYANDHTEYAQTLQRMYALAVGKAFKMRLTISSQEINELAENTLRHWIVPVCTACLGRGYEKFPNSPTLSDRECKHCEGTGRLSLDRAVKSHLKLAEWLQFKMDSVTGAFVASARNSTET